MNYMKFVFVFVGSMLLLLSFSNANVQAQTGIVWNTQFFNNPYLFGQPALTRQDTNVVFNWGSGSPAQGVNADQFTARFSTRTYFNAGTYRFTILADDGVQLIIDDTNIVVQTFDRPRVGQTITADVTLTAGQHAVQLDYREVTGDAYVYLNWTSVTGSNAPIVIPAQPSAPASYTWTAEYFNNANLTGSPIAIMGEVSPSHNWGYGAPLANMPANNFSARWRATLPLEGTYELSIRADDGVRVSVNGITYINEWHTSPRPMYTATFNVERGNHTIIIEYFESGGVAFMEYNLRAISSPITQPTQPPANIGWMAQYYNNNNLTGSPVATQTESGITRNWGTGAPLANMPADNFSVRWTSVQPLNAGVYRVSVRADDGVRVYVNGVSYINEWHTNDGRNSYWANVHLPTGNHSFMVEYYEATGNASIEYAITRTDNAAPAQPGSGSTNAQITVTSDQLNVRRAPSLFAGVITRIQRGESYPIVGRNADSSWWQVNVNGTTGWVSARYTSASNIQNVPVANGTTQVNPPSTGFTLTTTTNVNLRTGPGVHYSILSIVPRNAQVAILARNADTTWWQVSFNGAVGWVSASYVNLQPNATLSSIPIATQ